MDNRSYIPSQCQILAQVHSNIPVVSISYHPFMASNHLVSTCHRVSMELLMETTETMSIITVVIADSRGLVVARIIAIAAVAMAM